MEKNLTGEDVNRITIALALNIARLHERVVKIKAIHEKRHITFGFRDSEDVCKKGLLD